MSPKGPLASLLIDPAPCPLFPHQQPKTEEQTFKNRRSVPISDSCTAAENSHSITLSTRASRNGGIFKPSALEVHFSKFGPRFRRRLAPPGHEQPACERVYPPYRICRVVSAGGLEFRWGRRDGLSALHRQRVHLCGCGAAADPLLRGPDDRGRQGEGQKAFIARMGGNRLRNVAGPAQRRASGRANLVADCGGGRRHDRIRHYLLYDGTRPVLTWRPAMICAVLKSARTQQDATA
jgi:hypothetical protein